MIRHPLDVFSLLVGLLSIAGSTAWLLLEHGYVATDQLLWAGPVALVIVGVVAVAASLRPRPPSPPTHP